VQLRVRLAQFEARLFIRRIVREDDLAFDARLIDLRAKFGRAHVAGIVLRCDREFGAGIVELREYERFQGERDLGLGEPRAGVRVLSVDRDREPILE
jgi:hypothetical protein